MKIYKLDYFANHYANGGNWTHIVKVYDEQTKEYIFKIEEDRATDVKRKLLPFLSGNNISSLSVSMKYRENFYCSLLLSKSEVEFLKTKPEMNTYDPRHPD